MKKWCLRSFISSYKYQVTTKKPFLWLRRSVPLCSKMLQPMWKEEGGREKKRRGENKKIMTLLCLTQLVRWVATKMFCNSSNFCWFSLFFSFPLPSPGVWWELWRLGFKLGWYWARWRNYIYIMYFNNKFQIIYRRIPKICSSKNK